MYYRKHLSRHFSPNLNKKRKSNNSFIKLFRGIVGISTIIAALFGFLTFQNIGNLNDLKDNIKEQPNSQMAINEWKDELDNVRIDYGRDYIENILGTPKLVKSINFNKSMYTECIYNNSYFTLFCYYNNSSSLTGFLIIGNDKNFNIVNYRCGFSLFDYSINKAEAFCFDHGVQSYILLKNHSNNRLDNNRKAIKKLYKNLPKSSLNPFVAKLTSTCIEGCNEKETINIIDNLTTAIKNVDSGLVTNDSICYILVNHLIDFENWDTADQKALLLFCIVFNENTFTDDEIHQLFSNTSIYDNKIWKKLSFIVSQEKYKYIHTIYVDFFLNIFDHEAENDRIKLFNSLDFSRIIHNISNSLEMGKAKPYAKKIKYLAYAHNIYTILSKYLNIKNEVYQKLKFNIKIDIAETLNSYSFMLAKLCNNEQEIFEAENVQNLLINLFSTVKKSEYESNDEYYSSLNRFYNVFAKIFLSKYVLSYIRKSDDWKTHLQQSEEMLKKSITQLDFIENIKNKESRKEIMSYTEALVLYKKSISAYYIERQDSINKALTAIEESEKCSLNEISTFISSQNININRDIIKYLKEYNSQKYEKVLIELIDLKSDKTKKDKHNILLNMLYSHVATLQLKCIVLFMVFYFNNYEKDHITINISQNDVKRIIDFTLRNLGNDIMRKRELMILNVEFHRLFLNKNIIDELLQYPDNIQEDDTRFKFLKNCVSFLSNRFDAIDFDDINNNCISYTINKDLFKKEDHKRNYREIEKILYLLLIF